MIKKLIFATIIFLGLLTPVSSFAMEATLPELYGLGDLGYGLSLGGVWDFSGSKYKIDNIESYTQQRLNEIAEEKARQFIWDYCLQRNLPYPDNPSEALTDPKQYLMSSYFNKNVRAVYENWNVALEQGYVNADATLRMPISRQAITDWAGYRHNAWLRYRQTIIDNTIEDEVDTPSLPSAYENYTILGTHQIGTVNGSYDIDNLPWFIQNTQVSPVSVNYTLGLGTNTNQSLNNAITTGNYTNVFFTTVGSIYLIHTGNADEVTCTYDNFNYLQLVSGYSGFYSMFPNLNTNPYRWQFYSGNNNNNGMTNQSGRFTSVSAALSYLSDHFRFFNLYVDGDAWILIDTPAPANPVIPEFPDIINPDSDNPIDTVDLPNTTNYDGTFDITSLFDAIKEAIIGASDSDSTTSGILDKTAVTDGYRDIAGELVGDAVIPLSIAIDDSFPIQGTKNYPEIPLPEDPIHDAFRGTSILAQLINACQTVLPSELILVFWGIVFILFIIGLIKILHK